MNFIREMITRKGRPSDEDVALETATQEQQPVQESAADAGMTDSELISTLSNIQSKLRGESSPLETGKAPETIKDECAEQLDSLPDLMAARAEAAAKKRMPQGEPRTTAAPSLAPQPKRKEAVAAETPEKRLAAEKTLQDQSLASNPEQKLPERKPAVQSMPAEPKTEKVRPGLQDMPDVAPTAPDRTPIQTDAPQQARTASPPKAPRVHRVVEATAEPVAQAVPAVPTAPVVSDPDPQPVVQDEEHRVVQAAPQPIVQTEIATPKPQEPVVVQPKVASEPTEPNIVQVPAPAAGRSGRRAGRVKTRLLGFEHSQGMDENPFDAKKPMANPTRTNFPVGWIVVIKGPGRGTYFPLFNGVSQIGRGDDQAIRLDFGDSSISRSNHAAIAYDSEQRGFFLGHGGKANLVRLNNNPVLSTEKISNSDTVRIGETTLRFIGLCGEDFDWEIDDQDEFDGAASA